MHKHICAIKVSFGLSFFFPPFIAGTVLLALLSVMCVYNHGICDTGRTSTVIRKGNINMYVENHWMFPTVKLYLHPCLYIEKGEQATLGGLERPYFMSFQRLFCQK